MCNDEGGGVGGVGIQNYRAGMSYDDLLTDPERANIESVSRK